MVTKWHTYIVWNEFLFKVHVVQRQVHIHVRVRTDVYDPKIRMGEKRCEKLNVIDFNSIQRVVHNGMNCCFSCSPPAVEYVLAITYQV